jgi:hypothetical protein
METWSYLPELAPVFEKLRPELAVYRDARGRELFDVAELEVEAEDAAAAVRFLPEFDNMLLAHQDRTRFVPAAARTSVYLPGLRVAATVLIDGFVGGTWTAEREKNAAALRVATFEARRAAVRQEIEAEGARLLRFVEPGASSYTVEITPR